MSLTVKQKVDGLVREVEGDNYQTSKLYRTPKDKNK